MKTILKWLVTGALMGPVLIIAYGYFNAIVFTSEDTSISEAIEMANYEIKSCLTNLDQFSITFKIYILLGAVIGGLFGVFLVSRKKINSST